MNARTSLRHDTRAAVRAIHEAIRAGRYVSPRAVRRVLRMNEIAHATDANATPAHRRAILQSYAFAA